MVVFLVIGGAIGFLVAKQKEVREGAKALKNKLVKRSVRVVSNYPINQDDTK